MARCSALRAALLVASSLSAVGLGRLVAAQQMPANYTVVDVVALRPRYLPGIADKDTADIGGDVFFWLKDRILHPMHCRRSPSWGQCASGPLLYDDNVYTWTQVATSLPWGEYASCNPEPSDPSGRTWHCSGHGHSHGPAPPPNLNDLNMGRASISRFGHGQFDGDIYAPALSKLLSNSTSGFWYSNLHEGDCDSPNATACRWKVLKTVDSKNASCVNGQIEKTVLGRNNPCFGTCSTADRHNTTSDCWIDCFLRTIISMPRDEVLRPFQAAFESSDPSRGGCPSVL